MRRFTFLLAGLLSLVLFTAGCATTGVNRGDFNLISLQEEWQAGRQLEQDVARQVRLVGDATLTAYVNRIGQRIVQTTELRNLPWKFHVVADKSINAFNIPGGHVYVNTGLIERAENTAELAAVMAHEIAHGVSRHGTERLSKAQGINLGAGLLLGRNAPGYQQLVAQIAATGAIAKFSRNDEREADALGVRYLQQAGYNPNGMVTFFEKLLTDKRRSRGAVADFFATHPLTSERIDNVRRDIARLPRKNGLTTNEGSFRSIRQRAARHH